MDCKPMSTLMVSNLQKLHDLDTGLDPVDATLYSQLIRSLLYLLLGSEITLFTLLCFSLFPYSCLLFIVESLLFPQNKA